MRLFIVRHGETFANEKGIACGWYNSRLNKIGLGQSKKLASRLLNEKIDIIFCSDLIRCRQTIKPYLEKIKIKIHYTKLLRERHYGIFDGKPISSIIEWFNNNPGKDPNGWESTERFMERMSKFISENFPNMKCKNVLVVTHGRAKRMLLEILLAKSEKDKERIKERVHNTGLSIIDFSDDENPILELLNCNKHLYK